MFATVSHFHPSLIYEGKAGLLFQWLAPSYANKYQTKGGANPVELFLGGGYWSIISKCEQLVEVLLTSCHGDNWSTLVPPFSPSPNLSCREVALLATYPDLT